MAAETIETTVAVVGGGPAGLAAACLAHAAAQEAVLVAPASDDNDPRTVALMQPSIRLLAAIGVWPGNLRAVCAPLRKLALVDDTGGLFAAPNLTFDARELFGESNDGETAFGWNVPVPALIRALEAQVSALGLRRIASRAERLTYADGRAVIEAKTGERIAAKAVIAADGSGSRLRAAAGISATEWSYRQSAIATSFSHSMPHDGVSTEYHKPGGPFTTVPLPGNRSSLVWMERPERVQALMALADDAFAAAIQTELHGALGRVSEPGSRRAFPMCGLSALTFAKARVFLVGEAAHVVPPIGAQGLNMSLRDAALAAELIGDARAFGDDPGAQKVMAEYDRRRRRDVLPRQAIVDVMNRSILSGMAPFALARAAGLSALSMLPPLRRYAMQVGIGGAEQDLPRLMRA
ncbi:MAG: FAD-dependent monooxygenase [Hyphomicrobiales bacterium]